MAIGEKITAERINNLKEKVKAEMLRRNYAKSASSPSLNEYGDSSWDFSTAPARGKKSLVEHYNKLATPMHNLHTSHPSMDSVNSGTLMSDAELTDMETYILQASTRVKGSA